MHGLETMKVNDSAAIVLAYQKAVKDGDEKTAANIKYAHPDLAARLQ